MSIHYYSVLGNSLVLPPASLEALLSVEDVDLPTQETTNYKGDLYYVLSWDVAFALEDDLGVKFCCLGSFL